MARESTQYTILKNGCWKWNRSLNHKGYARCCVKGRTSLGHKLFYENKYGSVPAGMVLDHLCKNRQCVNPDHLEIVTNMINCQRGRQSKINPQAVLKIRAYCSRGIKRANIANMFNVNVSQIHRIIKGLTWANI